MYKPSFDIRFILLFIIFFIIVGGLFFYQSNELTICNKQLSESEYINHMITHHEVAVHMSEIHLHNTKNPLILDILRNLIRQQNYEINLMKDLNIISKINNEMSNKNIEFKNSYRYTVGDFTKPNAPNLSNTFCDPGFFKISHNKNLHNMTDAMYIQHMIPHHQVAVDMSKMILKMTNNNFLIDFAYKIIRDQQAEISKLYSLSTSKYSVESNIL